MAKQIYAIQHNITKRIYIGKSGSAENRIKKHMRDLLSGWHSNSELQKEFDEYGMEFSFYLIEDNVDANISREREMYWMSVFRSTDKKTGYNLAESKECEKQLETFTKIYLKSVRGILCEAKISQPVSKGCVRGNMPIYEKYAAIRDEKGISDYQVWKDTGIATATLSDWKNGISKPKTDKLKILADYFGVTVDYFVRGE